LGLVSYILKRVLFLIPVLLGVTLITFVVSRVIVPNPARAWGGPRATAEVIAALTTKYHLNGPLYEQYYYYLRDLVTLDWGNSPISGRPVLHDIAFFFPSTLELAIASIVLAMLIGIPLGIVASLRRDRSVDHVIRVSYLTGFASPPFFLAIVFLLVFGYVFKIFPTQGELSVGLTPPTRITGMYIVDSLLTGNWIDLRDSLWHIVLPAAALTFTFFGIITRITRSSMLEVLQTDFIRASFAKGLSDRKVLFRHTVRNALVPTTTVIGFLFGALLGGTVVIEEIFSWPGIGYYTIQAIENLDFPTIMAVTLIFTLGVVFANLAADIVYVFLNPRIKV